MEGAMKLLLCCSQKPGILGDIKLSASAMAELADQQRTAICAYRFGTMLLYERSSFKTKTIGGLEVFAFIRYWLTNLTLAVSGLECGKRIDCKDILHMLSVEAAVKEAAAAFKAILQSAWRFDGEEVIESE
jgi:hypothetical protein